MRIHVPLATRVRGYIGHATAIAGALFALIAFALVLHSCVPPAEAGLIAIEQPQKIVVAQKHDGTIRSNLMLFRQPDATRAGTLAVHVGDSGCPSPNVALAPGDSRYVRDYANVFLCGSAEFQLIDAPPAEVNPSVLVEWPNGNGLVIPPLNGIAVGQSLSYGMIVNDSHEITVITLVDTAATINAVVYGPTNTVIGTEKCVSTKPVTQCVLRTPVSSGRVVLSIDAPVCSPCIPPDAVYPVVTVGTPVNTNARVLRGE